MTPTRTAKLAEGEPSHAVKVLAPSLLIESRSYVAGDVVDVPESVARRLHAEGGARVVDERKIRDLPAAPRPAVPAAHEERFPDDPRVTVEVLKGTVFYRGRSSIKGDEVTLPERLAVQYLDLGVALLADGQALSPRGMIYLNALRIVPHANPSY